MFPIQERRCYWHGWVVKTHKPNFDNWNPIIFHIISYRSSTGNIYWNLQSEVRIGVCTPKRGRIQANLTKDLFTASSLRWEFFKDMERSYRNTIRNHATPFTSKIALIDGKEKRGIHKRIINISEGESLDVELEEVSEAFMATLASTSRTIESPLLTTLSMNIEQYTSTQKLMTRAIMLRTR